MSSEDRLDGGRPEHPPRGPDPHEGLSPVARPVLGAAYATSGCQPGQPLVRRLLVATYGLTVEQVADAWGELLATGIVRHVGHDLFVFSATGLERCEEP